LNQNGKNIEKTSDHREIDVLHRQWISN